MKQYRQQRQTNEQTRTMEYIAPVCNTYLQHRQTDRQTIGHGQLIYLQLTRKYDIVCTITQFGWYLSMSCLFLDMGILQ